MSFYCLYLQMLVYSPVISALLIDFRGAGYQLAVGDIQNASVNVQVLFLTIHICILNNLAQVEQTFQNLAHLPWRL